jgi:exosortase/archaeosortase family protein
MLLEKNLSKQLFVLVLSYSLWLLVYNTVLIPYTLLDEWIVHLLVVVSCLMLSFFGFDVSTNPAFFLNAISIDHYPGVVISHHCDALSVVVIFIIILCVFSFRKPHLWRFILFGSVVIQFVNILRIVCLSIIFRFHPGWLKFNHDYTFTILVYGVVILMWWWRFRSIDNLKVK